MRLLIPSALSRLAATAFGWCAIANLAHALPTAALFFNQPEPVVQGLPSSRWARMTSGVNMPYWMSLPSLLAIERMKTWTGPTEMRVQRNMGVKHVRLPIIPETVVSSYDPLIFDPARIDYLRTTLSQYKQNGIYVILDLHPDDAFRAKLRDNPAEIMKLRNFWKGLASRLSDLDPEFLGFEILNEPNFKKADQWWDVQRVLLRDIRQIAPRHTIFANSDRWSSVDELISRRPYDDPNVVYVLHFYEPFIFTHQGAHWVDDHLGGFRGVRYPSDPSNNESLRGQASSRERRDVLNRYIGENWGPSQVRARIQLVADWAERNRVKVICNEFGTLRDGVDQASKALWHRDVRMALEQNDIGWTVWEWRGGMGVVRYNITTSEGFDSADWMLVDALGFRRPPVPK